MYLITHYGNLHSFTVQEKEYILVCNVGKHLGRAAPKTKWTLNSSASPHCSQHLMQLDHVHWRISTTQLPACARLFRLFPRAEAPGTHKKPCCSNQRRDKNPSNCTKCCFPMQLHQEAVGSSTKRPNIFRENRLVHWSKQTQNQILKFRILHVFAQSRCCVQISNYIIWFNYIKICIWKIAIKWISY